MADKAQTSHAYISNPLQLIQPSFEAFKINLATFLALVVSVIGAVVVAFGSLLVWAVGSGLGDNYSVELSSKHLPEVILWSALALVLMGAILAFFAPAISLVVLKSAKAEKISYGNALRGGLPYIGRFLLIGILSVLAFVGGLVLFIVPALIFSIWFSLAFYVAIDENLPAVAAMKRSKQLVSGHFWEMAGMLSLPNAFGILSIVPVLGWIVSTILSIIYIPAPAIRYFQLKELGDAEVPVHWVNYVVIVLGLMSFGLRQAANNSQPQPEWLKQIDQSIQQK